MDRRSLIARSTLGLAGLWLAPRSSAQGFQPKTWSDPAEILKPLQCIAFGSCNRSDLDQSYWRLVARENPDLWLWLGDSIYADGLSLEQRRGLYRQQFENPYYQAFRRDFPILGTWDDHDYAGDNADGRFSDKLASKQALLEFLDVPEAHPVWSQEGGVYQSQIFGPRGQQVQVVLLDLRFNMDRQRREATLLGERQWAWLEQELLHNTADLLIIGSSLNVLAPSHGLGLEGWQGFAGERQRLLELLAAAQKPSLIISGDRHFAEFAQCRLANGLPLYELMSSGLTHAFGIKLPHPGRVGEMVGFKNFGLLRIYWETNGPSVHFEIKSTERYQSYLGFQSHYVIP